MPTTVPMNRATACSQAVWVHDKMLSFEKEQQASEEQQELERAFGHCLRASRDTSTKSPGGIPKSPCPKSAIDRILLAAVESHRRLEMFARYLPRGGGFRMGVAMGDQKAIHEFEHVSRHA